MADGLDEEIKSIFDNLRSAGSPHDYSLDEALVKAIRAEEELLQNKARISKKKSSFSIFKEAGLQFQVAVILLLTLGGLCLVYILPLQQDQGVTKHFREIQGQVIK